MTLNANQIIYLTHYMLARNSDENDSLFLAYIDALDNMPSYELEAVQKLMSICATIEYMFAKVTH